MKTNKVRYGLFYKSRGQWVGPYHGIVGTRSLISNTREDVKDYLKSKTDIRKIKFV